MPEARQELENAYSTLHSVGANTQARHLQETAN